MNLEYFASSSHPIFFFYSYPFHDFSYRLSGTKRCLMLKFFPIFAIGKSNVVLSHSQKNTVLHAMSISENSDVK
jgi:hypothetical protein